MNKIKVMITDSLGNYRATYLSNLSGKAFGRLVALSPIKEANEWKWICKCSCGKETIASTRNLCSNHTTSCGCFGREQAIKSVTTHGLGHTPEYRIWFAMINRCHNPDHKGYRFYKKRNISVCNGWRNSFESFYKDMGTRPEGLTIDRIDNNLGYNCGHCEDCKSRNLKENCRWTTWRVQSRNKVNTKMFEYKGEKMVATDLAKKLGLDESIFKNRLLNGWTIQRAIETPIIRRRKGAKCI